jgi:lysophospholipase L1-like esterase
VDFVAEARPHVEVVNAGCWGATTWQWTIDGAPPGYHCGSHGMSLWDELVRDWLPAQRAYVLLGTNDARTHAYGYYDRPVSPLEYALNLSALIDRLRSAGVVQIVLLAPHDPVDADAEQLARLADYRRIITAFCAPEFSRVTCGPDLSEVLGPEDLVDGVHPNQQGHRKIAEAILALDDPASLRGPHATHR